MSSGRQSKRTAAKLEAERQRHQHGEPLLGKDGRVDPAAVFRAARRAAPDPPMPPAAPEAIEPAEGIEDDEDLAPDAAPAPGADVTFTLQRDLDKRLDRYLVDRITFMSRSKLQDLIDAGGVTVNGRRAKASTRLHAGDAVSVRVPAPEAEDFPAEDIPLDVMYEDEHLIVINKHADLIVHPARTHTRGTMINALAFHFRHRSGLGGGLSSVGSGFARPGVVHRLDRHTTGGIVFAKSDLAHWRLADQFMNRTVDKRYVAVTHGRVAPLIDAITEPIGPHPSRAKGYREKYVVRHDHLGKDALTIYRVLGEYGPDARDGFSLVEVELKTGRTHQIRVHFSHRGYPLVGDDMYGGKPVEVPGTGTVPGTLIGRQALHAAVLGFVHPISGARMRFVAPLPPDLRGLIAGLRARPGAREHPEPAGAVLRVDDLLASPAQDQRKPPPAV